MFWHSGKNIECRPNEVSGPQTAEKRFIDYATIGRAGRRIWDRRRARDDRRTLDAHPRSDAVVAVARSAVSVERSIACYRVADPMPASKLQNNAEVGEWKIGKLLGEGGQGPVWAVRSTKTKNLPPRALKACFATGETPRRRFEREIELLGKCDSPYIVKKLDADPTWTVRVENVDAFAFHVTELCEGSLDSDTDLDAGRRVAYFRDACRAVMYLHAHPEQIIHRDIKPANFLLAVEPRRLVLADFGIARQLLASPLTTTQEVVGSKYFRAPEILNGDGGSVQSDVYSLGRLLEWILTGDVSRSFDTRPIPRGGEFSDEVADVFDRVIVKATQVASKDRFASVPELLDQLPPLWLAVKPTAIPKPDDIELDDAMVSAAALELARKKDTIGWRQIERQVRRTYPDRVTAWRRENDRPLKDKAELFEVVDRLVVSVYGRIAIPLVGVFSQDPAFVDQRKVVDDLLAVPTWSGSDFAEQAPRGLVYLFHHLHGALCCDLGRMDLALQLVEMTVPQHGEKQAVDPLWRQYDMQIVKLLQNRMVAWEYLRYLKLPIIDEIFGLRRDYEIGLASYILLMCLLELGFDSARMLTEIKSSNLTHIDSFEVAPMFGDLSADVIRTAVSRTIGSRQTVALVVGRANAKHDVVREVWTKWKSSLNRWYFGGSWRGGDQLSLGDLAL